MFKICKSNEALYLSKKSATRFWTKVSQEFSAYRNGRSYTEQSCQRLVKDSILRRRDFAAAESTISELNGGDWTQALDAWIKVIEACKAIKAARRQRSKKKGKMAGSQIKKRNTKNSDPDPNAVENYEDAADKHPPMGSFAPRATTTNPPDQPKRADRHSSAPPALDLIGDPSGKAQPATAGAALANPPVAAAFSSCITNTNASSGKKRKRTGTPTARTSSQSSTRHNFFTTERSSVYRISGRPRGSPGPDKNHETLATKSEVEASTNQISIQLARIEALVEDGIRGLRSEMVELRGENLSLRKSFEEAVGQQQDQQQQGGQQEQAKGQEEEEEHQEHQEQEEEEEEEEEENVVAEDLLFDNEEEHIPEEILISSCFGDERDTSSSSEAE